MDKKFKIRGISKSVSLFHKLLLELRKYSDIYQYIYQSTYYSHSEDGIHFEVKGCLPDLSDEEYNNPHPYWFLTHSDISILMFSSKYKECDIYVDWI